MKHKQTCSPNPFMFTQKLSLLSSMAFILVEAYIGLHLPVKDQMYLKNFLMQIKLETVVVPCPPPPVCFC